MLYCKCGYRIKINAAIKSHVRYGPYAYDCRCGNRIIVTAEDVNASDAYRMKFYKEKRGVNKK